MERTDETTGPAAAETPGTALERLSPKALRLALRPDHMGEMEKPDAQGVITGDCGDRDAFFCRIFSSRIQEVRFLTTGCLYTVACCEAVACLAEGRTVREAMRIDQTAVAAYLEGLPEDHMHCALLAAGTLYQALRSYLIRGTGL